MDSDGPLVVVDQIPYGDWTTGQAIYLVDLAHLTVATLKKAPTGFRAWAPSISGHRIAWLEWHYEGPGDTGALDWHIVATDLDAGQTWTVASGVQHEAGASFGASWPSLDLDANHLAYAIEDPTRAPDGWKVVIASLPDGVVERTVPTDLPVYDLALDGDNVAFTEGRTDPGQGFTYDTKLVVSIAGSSSPREVASNAFEVSFARGRLAWSQDTPKRITGAGVGTRMWTATSPKFVGQPVSPGPGLGTEQYQAWPATGDGYVTWDSARLSESDPTVNGDRFCVWDPHDGIAYELLPSPGASQSGAGGGWFVWINDRLAIPTISGVPIADVGLP